MSTRYKLNLRPEKGTSSTVEGIVSEAVGFGFYMLPLLDGKKLETPLQRAHAAYIEECARSLAETKAKQTT